MEYTLIHTIINSIVTAFIFGMLAKKLNLPTIFGYLIAGIAIGPHTPGFVADVLLAKQLAEIGIILLMFGIGLHFTLKDLIDSRKVAFPSAILQMFCSTMIGASMGIFLEYSLLTSLVFGLSLSVASTIVLLRSLEQRHLIEHESGKLAISWLVIQDIVMVFILVLLPVISEMMQVSKTEVLDNFLALFLSILFKMGGFFVFMFVLGRRFIPWLFVRIAKMRSVELNTLCTLSISLGFASIAYFVFDTSLALGSFLAGVMLGETEIGKKAADNIAPMKDTFSVLFFVSVGMLFDPHTLWQQPIHIICICLIIILSNSSISFFVLKWFNKPLEVRAIIAIGLAQIGEFSFILAGLALSKNIIPQEVYNLVLAGAIVSIVVNPFLFRLYDSCR